MDTGTGRVWDRKIYTHARIRILTRFFHTHLKPTFATHSDFKWAVLQVINEYEFYCHP